MHQINKDNTKNEMILEMIGQLDKIKYPLVKYNLGEEYDRKRENNKGMII